MTIYQRHTSNPYILPDNLYRQMVWLVRDYDRFKHMYNSILQESGYRSNNKVSGGSYKADPTAGAAIRRSKLAEKIEAVDYGLSKIPKEYRAGIEKHSKYRTPYPPIADRTTWFRWQSRFYHAVAEKLGEVEPIVK